MIVTDAGEERLEFGDKGSLVALEEEVQRLIGANTGVGARRDRTELCGGVERKSGVFLERNIFLFLVGFEPGTSWSDRRLEPLGHGNRERI